MLATNTKYTDPTVTYDLCFANKCKFNLRETRVSTNRNSKRHEHTLKYIEKPLTFMRNTMKNH